MTFDPTDADTTSGEGPQPAVTPEAPPEPRDWLLPGPTPAPSGWIVAEQSSQSTTKPLRERNLVVQIGVWLVGILGIAILALASAGLRSRSSTGTGAFGTGYEVGLVVGSLVAGLGVGLVVVFFVARARRKAGHPPLSFAWSLPVAAAVLFVSLAGQQATPSPVLGPGATPAATSPSARSYNKISSPYSLGPTTSADAAVVTQISSGVGKSGITDASVERVSDSSAVLRGYLVVLVVPGASGNSQDFIKGFLESMSESSISPTTSTIDGRSVFVFAQGSVNGVAWLDGDFFVEVIGADQASGNAIAKAVLDAH
jgi:hypothetical protein